MRWQKLGNIFNPGCSNPFLISHASNPLVHEIGANVLRVFYNGRNSENKSSISYFDFNIRSLEVVSHDCIVVTEFGAETSCASHGISNGCLVEIDDSLYILGMAWQIHGDDHWRGDIGSVKLNNELTLGELQEQPFLTTDDEFDKVSLSYPWILNEEGVYKMWYGSTITWQAENDEMIHTINFAESNDLKTWRRKGIAIPYKENDAQAFSRPTVIKHQGKYHMWYSYRSGDGTPYRIGYAWSLDGMGWTRDDDLSGISVSNEGWDSEMVCYPCVFEFENELYMMYNGNSHGKTGVGLARLEK